MSQTGIGIFRTFHEKPAFFWNRAFYSLPPKLFCN